jgi:translation initiation factor 2B subunit (eIF-2B alpha/beta/delta family)
LTRRGDITVLAVDTPVGYGLARALERADVDAVTVRDSGIGAAAAAADVVMIDATAVGPDGVIAASGSRAAAAVARAAGRHVIVAAGEATVLPARMWEALCTAVDAEDDPWDADYELVPLSLVETMIGPTGALEPARAVTRADCPIAAELLRPLR